MLAGIAASTLILGLCGQVKGNWYLLDFFGLVPWLLSLDAIAGARRALLSGYLMCTAFVLAIFAWFGFAIAVYSAGAAAAGIVAITLTAPLLQPQFLVFAVVRAVASRSYGWALRALIGASAWVATEWMFPKLLADSLAHGFYPSPVLRQTADIAGTAGITFLIVVINEALARAIVVAARLRTGGGGATPATALQQPRETRGTGLLPPLAAAAGITAAMVAYGHWRLAEFAQAPPDASRIRVALVQSNISAYDRLRREMGAYEAVRYVLDTHFAMSRKTVDDDRVHAVVWSETVFPTTFGKPKSETGAELDREIHDFVSRLGVPLVFGSYDQDANGEYNSAVFLEPGAVGGTPRFDLYRKTRLFFLTEYIPWWLEPARPLLPWAGNWKPGSGAKVMPLHAGGRTVPVLPMICLDDVDTSLGADGARLGAEMILTMSNDSWFTEHAGGAHLHQVVAAFRSVETRLPQLRVTNNGITSVIDETGEVRETIGVGERRVLVGEVAPHPAGRTLIVRWGDWLGPVGLLVSATLLLAARVRGHRHPEAD